MPISVAPSAGAWQPRHRREARSFEATTERVMKILPPRVNEAAALLSAVVGDEDMSVAGRACEYVVACGLEPSGRAECEAALRLAALAVGASERAAFSLASKAASANTRLPAQQAKQVAVRCQVLAVKAVDSSCEDSKQARRSFLLAALAGPKACVDDEARSKLAVQSWIDLELIAALVNGGGPAADLLTTRHRLSLAVREVVTALETKGTSVEHALAVMRAVCQRRPKLLFAHWLELATPLQERAFIDVDAKVACWRGLALVTRAPGRAVGRLVFGPRQRANNKTEGSFGLSVLLRVEAVYASLESEAENASSSSAAALADALAALVEMAPSACDIKAARVFGLLLECLKGQTKQRDLSLALASVVEAASSSSLEDEDDSLGNSVIALRLKEQIEHALESWLLREAPLKADLLDFLAACLLLEPSLDERKFDRALDDAEKPATHSTPRRVALCGILERRPKHQSRRIARLCGDRESPKIRSAACRAAAAAFSSKREEEKELLILEKALINVAQGDVDGDSVAQACRALGVAALRRRSLEATAAVARRLRSDERDRVRAQAAFALSNVGLGLFESSRDPQTSDDDDETLANVAVVAVRSALVALENDDDDDDLAGGSSRVLGSALRAAGYLVAACDKDNMALVAAFSLAETLVSTCASVTSSSLSSRKAKRNCCLAVGVAFKSLDSQNRRRAVDALVAFLASAADDNEDVDDRKAIAGAADTLADLKDKYDLPHIDIALAAALRALRRADNDGPFSSSSSSSSSSAKDKDTPFSSQKRPRRAPRRADEPSQRRHLFARLSRLTATLLNLADFTDLRACRDDLAPHLDFLYLWLCSRSALPNVPALLNKIATALADDDYNSCATLDRFFARARMLGGKPEDNTKRLIISEGNNVRASQNGPAAAPDDDDDDDDEI